VSNALARRSAARLIALGVAWVAAAAWVAARLNQGWVPHDDGSFAQSAQRVLDGQLPHREFAELYTGGLTFLNAAVFGLVGDDLIWLRIPMFVLFLLFVPCCYAIARRFATPPVALVTTAFAVAWSVPVYPAAVPSWYLLFFSFFGAYCVIRYFETGRHRWLFLAGLFGGLSISFKIVGVWFVLAVLISLVVAEQTAHARVGSRPVRIGGYQVFVISVSLAALALVTAVLRPHLGGSELANLLIPIASLCCIPVLATRAAGTPPAAVRLRWLARRVLPFLAGVAVPTVAVALPYVFVGAVPDLIDGVFVAPRARVDYSYAPLPGPLALLWALPVVGALVVRHYVPRARRVIDVAGVIVLGALLVTASSDRSYLLLWDSARALGPLVVVAGAILLAFRPSVVADATLRLELLLVLLVAGFGSLVQFPFGAPVYYCYVAPLFALAAVAIARCANVRGVVLPISILVTYAVFGLLFLDRASLFTLGYRFQVDPQTVILDERRASIRVSPLERDEYRRAASILERRASGDFVFAGPDAPELYVLSGRKNPTRSLFDFVDRSDSARGDRLLRTLRERSVTVVAINRRPDFSDPLDAATVRRLASLYPRHARIGRFDVRWRGGA
jgi:hypothetical protein